MSVWVMRIDHQDGNDTRVFRSRSAAVNAVFAYIKEWWNRRVNANEPIPTDKDAAIDRYFECADDERFEIQSSEIWE
jgi:hypothetical protein